MSLKSDLIYLLYINGNFFFCFIENLDMHCLGRLKENEEKKNHLLEQCCNSTIYRNRQRQ